ncbi:MAG TPA: hypothetical protein VLL72_01320, partial [Kiloniellales bacterium]|nr:hypothetical protein [Kiloniellales bacterium]
MTGPARQTTAALRQARGREGVRRHRRTLERRRQFLRLGGLCLACALAGGVTGALVGSLGSAGRIPSSRIAILITEPGPESIAADYPPPAETAASPDASPDAVSEAG